MTIDNPSTVAERILLTELADELQCRKQSLFKILPRLGISPIKQRDPDRRNQMVSTVTHEEASIIRREVLSWARNGGTTQDGEQLITDDGVFYLIQLEPEHDPGRIKLGFTTSLDGRLQKHRCSAPFATCLKKWPCRRTWERAAMDCATDGVEQLHTEVFRANSIDDVIARCDRFFAVMPLVADTTGSEESD